MIDAAKGASVAVKLTAEERARRDAIVLDLGRGHHAVGREAVRQVARDLYVSLPTSFDVYSPAADLMQVFDAAEELVRTAQDDPGGEPALFAQHMRYYTDSIKLEIDEEVVKQGWSWSYLDRDPFSLWTTPQWYERLRGMGIVLSDELTEPLPERTIADLDGLQILLLRREQLAYGWVGVGGFGFVDRFHLERPLKEEAPATNVGRLVRGLAYALSLDLRLPAVAGQPAMLQRAMSTFAESFARLEADDAYRDQVASVRSFGSTLVAAHWRVAHLREGEASLEKIVSAPERFKRYVGDGWTWVKGHEVRGSVRLTVQQLANRSSIADAVGMAFKKPAGT